MVVNHPKNEPFHSDTRSQVNHTDELSRTVKKRGVAAFSILMLTRKHSSADIGISHCF